MVYELTKSWPTGVAVWAWRVIHGLARELARVGRKILDHTWVSLPIFVADGTVIIIDNEPHWDHRLWSPRESADTGWELTGTICRICGRFKAVTAVVIDRGHVALSLRMHSTRSEPLISREIGTR